MRRTVLRRGVAGAFLLCAAAFLAPDAEAFSNVAFIQPSGLTADQMFGAAVAIDGNVMAVSTRAVAPNVPSAVYVFANVSGTWTQQGKLTGELDFSLNAFGASLAVEGDTLFVGDGVALDEDGYATGAVFVYRNSNGTWTQQVKLTPAGAPNGAHFGGQFYNNSLWISGNTLFVGAPDDDGPAGRTGAVYAFVNNGGAWTQQAKIAPDDPTTTSFGLNVAAQNTTLVVGAPFAHSSAGAAFVSTLQNGQWTSPTALAPLDPASSGALLFGASVSVDGNIAAVGAPFANAAYIYANNNGAWSPQARIADPAGSGDDVSGTFGESLSLVGKTLLVAAYEDFSPVDGTPTGVGYVFSQNGTNWVSTAQEMAPGLNGIPNTGGIGEQRFGQNVAVSGSGGPLRFVMTAPAWNAPGIDNTNLATHVSLGGIYTFTQ
jgi:hypothetical protein